MSVLDRWVAPAIAALCILGLLPATVRAQDDDRWRTPSARWLEAEPNPGNRPATVRGYLAEMESKSIPEEVLVIAGSATARRWDVQKWFSDFRVVNRGFGGSRIDDNTHFAEQLLIPLKPSTLVLYAGDNDLWAGKPVDVTVRHFDEFVDVIHESLPETQIVFVAIRPSIARWEIWDVMQEANRLIQERIDANPNLHYADIVPVTLGDDGRPRPEFFVDDDLHLTDLGYVEWTRVVKPVVRGAEARYRELRGCGLCGSQR